MQENCDWKKCLLQESEWISSTISVFHHNIQVRSWSHVLWITTYVLSAKSFCQSVQKLWREAKRDGEKQQEEWQSQSFLRYMQTLKCRGKCRTGTHFQHGRDLENFKKLQKREHGKFWPDTGVLRGIWAFSWGMRRCWDAL